MNVTEKENGERNLKKEKKAHVDVVQKNCYPTNAKIDQFNS